MAEGGGSAGYALYNKGGKLIYEYNFFGKAIYKVESRDPAPAGEATVVLDYTQRPFKPYVESTGGPAKMYVNGALVGEGEIENAAVARFSATETLDIGMDLGSTVTPAYREKAPRLLSRVPSSRSSSKLRLPNPYKWDSNETNACHDFR